MGLDTTRNCWHGPYSSFGRWRDEVAAVVGVPLRLMAGFYPGIHSDETIDRWLEFFAPREGGPLCRDARGPLLHNWLAGIRGILPIQWEALRPDPIHLLLNHSDCEGGIAAEDCLPLAARLEEIAPLLPDEPAWHRGEGARAKALQFAKGLREAAAAGEPVGFH